MNSARQVGNGGDPSPSPFDKRPAFFKIILPGLHIHRLRIPPAFTAQISSDLHAKARLRGPSTGWWEVKLAQIDGKIYINQGWKQFYDHHSLGDYEFLLFKYNGGLCFDVYIFEKSGCERITNSSAEEEHEQHQQQQPGFKRKRGRPRKKPVFVMKTKGVVLKGSTVEKKEVKVEENHDHTVAPPFLKKHRDYSVSSLRSLDSFASVFPYFKCIMTISCVEKSFVVPIPQEFTNEYFPRTKEVVLTTLNNTKGKEWKVKVISSRIGRRVISGGWRLFVRENNILLDNVCVFELLDNIRLIRVHILQNSEE